MNQASVFQLKVTLVGMRPPIWRRLRIPGNMLLSDLHAVLQGAMGWCNSHLHQFRVGDVYYGTPIPELEFKLQDETRFRVGHVLQRTKQRMSYEYDFGDGWLHHVVVERITSPSPGEDYPCVVAGRRRCPPEDIGGVAGYERFLEAMRDSSDPEHQAMRRWWGSSFDPDVFSIDEANAAIRRTRRGARSSNNTLDLSARPVTGRAKTARPAPVRPAGRRGR